MLVKVKDGSAVRLIHAGIRYYFNKNEIKDCPESILSGYRGLIVSAETRIQPVPEPVIEYKKQQKMPVIDAEEPKIKIPSKIKGTIKKKEK
jgi:hypothetical protein